MRYLKYLALLGLLALPLTYSQAQVRFGVGIGIGPGYIAGPPACPYGYYPDYPYGCAPYGYYGPSYFVGGVFIGAGPWFHGYGHRYSGRPIYSNGYYDRDHRRFYDRDDRGFRGRPSVGRPDFNGRSFDRHAPGPSYRGNSNGHRSEGDHRGDGRR